ncbi:MAG: hypothetical protein E7L19_17100 [Acinetobacter baumannii]|nr:hypothetical protein [Acinetobacter baumannii]
MSTIKEVINDAGGVCTVAFAVQLSERSIYKWIEKNCLPRSEYTGDLMIKIVERLKASQLVEKHNLDLLTV